MIPRRLVFIGPWMVITLACGASRGSPTNTGVDAVGDCGPPLAAADAELVTVAEATVYPGLLWTSALGSQRVAGLRFYAVVDDDGFVGTLQATTRNTRCAHLAMVGSCYGFEEWNARWVDTPRRSWSFGMLAFGPVNARFTSAQRLVPERPTCIDENNVRIPRATHADNETWTRLAAISINAGAGDPSAIEVWGRRCAANTASVRETRLTVKGQPRVVQRAVVTDITAQRAFTGTLD
jgi:hypothetical protein